MAQLRICIAILFLSAFASGNAFADDVPAASKAFAKGQSASLSGKHADAAGFYELANSMAPSAQALRSAARSRHAAGHIATAASHAAELANLYPKDKSSQRLSNKILKELTPKLARIEIICDAPCSLTIDGSSVADAQLKHLIYVRPGSRQFDARFSEKRVVKRAMTGRAGESFTLEFEAPLLAEPLSIASDASTPSSSRKPLPKKWTLISGGVSVALGIAATAYGLKTLSMRTDITDAVAEGNDARRLYNDGLSTQRITNGLLAATAVGVSVTAVLAYFTDWNRKERSPTFSATADNGGATILFSGDF